MPTLPSLDYLYLPGKLIEDREDFYRSGIKEASKIRNLCTVCQRLFVTTSKKLNLYILGDKDVYKIDIHNKEGRLIAQVYYLPGQMRLDLYDGDDPRMPLFMWKSKKCIYKNIPVLLDTIKVETLLVPLISIL